MGLLVEIQRENLPHPFSQEGCRGTRVATPQVSIKASTTPLQIKKNKIASPKKCTQRPKNIAKLLLRSRRLT